MASRKNPLLRDVVIGDGHAVGLRTCRIGGVGSRTAARFVGLILLTGVCQQCTGQDTSAEQPVASRPPQAAKSVSDAPVQFVGPDTYILLDNDGNPQPFPGMSYEDFMAAWQQLNAPQAADARGPRYSIEQFHVEGRSRGSHAELHVSVKVLLLVDEPVRIPLRMARAIVRDSKVGKNTSASERDQNGSGDYLAYDAASGGLVAWLQGKKGERHQLQLDVLVPLEREGNETALRLACPRAVSSKLDFVVPGPVFGAVASGESVLSRQPADNAATRLEVEGVAGQFELRWRTDKPEFRQSARMLRAIGALRARIDGHSVRTEVRLRVQSFGREFTQFYVHLPPGAAFLPADPAELPYALIPLKSGEVPEGFEPATPGDWVLVRLREGQSGPVDVTLATEQPLQLDGSDLTVELRGFEVLDAFRQLGDVGLVVDDNWQLRWEPGDYVRQVEAADTAEWLSGDRLTAAFKYDRETWSLRVQLAPRRTRVHAIPKYQLQILADEARLRAELNYSISGAGRAEFRTDLRGWRETNVSDPAGLFDTIPQTDDQTLLVRLKEAAPSNVQLVFEARREIAPAADRVELPLPAPLADVVGSGELVVFSPPNLALAPDASRSVGLAPEVVAADAASVANGPPGYHALAYRTLSPDPSFAAERTIRSREVITDVESQIQLGLESGRVEQIVHYQVHYEPLQRLEIDLPAVLTAPEAQLRFELLPEAGGNAAGESSPLEMMGLADPTDATAESDRRAVQLLLPQPALGRFAVRIRFHLGGSVWDGAPLTQVAVPLAVPLDGMPGSHVASVTSAPSRPISLASISDPPLWRTDISQQDGDGRALQLVASGRVGQLPLRLDGTGLFTPSSTVVQRVWLQTWFAADVRQTRAVYQFQTDRPEVTLEFPSGVPADQMVSIDGTRVPVNLQPSRPLSIPVPATADRQSHTLEVVYRQPSPPGILRRVQIDPPLLEGEQAVGQVYWQVIIPSDTFLLGKPAQLTSASRWGWLGTHFGERAVLEQPELERWTGADVRLPPAPTENQYLFHGLARITSLEVVTVRRWLVVLAGSSAVLALGLLLAYVPGLRRVELLAAAAIGLVVLTLAFPGLALLVGQAAVLGMGLAAVALALRHYSVAGGRRAWTSTSSTATARPSSSLEKLTPLPVGSTPVGASSAAIRTADSHS